MEYSDVLVLLMKNGKYVCKKWIGMTCSYLETPTRTERNY